MSTHCKVGVTQSVPSTHVESVKHQSSTNTCCNSAIKKHAISALKRIIRHNVRAHHEDTWSYCILLDSAQQPGPDLTSSQSIEASLIYLGLRNTSFPTSSPIIRPWTFSMSDLPSKSAANAVDEQTYERAQQVIAEQPRRKWQSYFLLTSVLRSESSCSRLILLCLLWLPLV